MTKKLGDDWYECFECKGHFHAVGFYKNKTKLFGLSSNCKDCEDKRIAKKSAKKSGMHKNGIKYLSKIS